MSRADRMPRLIADARKLILTGELPAAGNSFAVSQITDEADKRAFLGEHPNAADALLARLRLPSLASSIQQIAEEAASWLLWGAEEKRSVEKEVHLLA
jgi:hypothetical protein